MSQPDVEKVSVHRTVHKELKVPMLPVYAVYSWTEQWGGGSLAVYWQHKDWAMRVLFFPFTRQLRGQLERSRKENSGVRR